jgi:hypothetical protein
MSIVTKEQYDAAVALFAAAKKAAEEIRCVGWTVYEVIQHEASPIPYFQPRYQVTESLDAAMSKPLNREAQYLIMKELYAPNGLRFYEDGRIITEVRVRGAAAGRVLEGWLRDKTADIVRHAYPACHDQWLRVRLEDYGEQASVLDDVKKPAEWLSSLDTYDVRGKIRIVFPAGVSSEPSAGAEKIRYCDGDCCCDDSDSDTGSEGGDYDDSDEE